jgi:hypothetical protein
MSGSKLTTVKLHTSRWAKIIKQNQTLENYWNFEKGIKIRDKSNNFHVMCELPIMKIFFHSLRARMVLFLIMDEYVTCFQYIEEHVICKPYMIG